MTNSSNERSNPEGWREKLEQAKKKREERRREAVAEAEKRAEEEERLKRIQGLGLREYQRVIFDDRATGIQVLHWSRQIGKSYSLAAWAVDRLLCAPGRLVTVLSNSRENGAEFVAKCAEVCTRMGEAYETSDESPKADYENMRLEVRVTRKNRTGRIKVLAANPRTARGFSGDLILDEFAFHEDAHAIWEAAEPILSSNADFLCRIASTGNGKHNLFYRLVTSGQFNVSRITRTDAFHQGVPIFDPVTRATITPDEARAAALDKAAYDQNYECAFADENISLLPVALISAAERSPIAIDSQEWSADTLERLRGAQHPLEAGLDVGRQRDLSVLTVIERDGHTRRVIGMLRMAEMRLPAQQAQADLVCQLPRLRSLQVDMTGIGLGLCEYLQERHGSRVRGVNFSSTEPISDRLAREGRHHATARVTEIMATDLLAAFEERSIEIPADHQLRDDLRKPEKITSPSGRVSIAASRDGAGHADHFWSLALAVRAGGRTLAPFEYERVSIPGCERMRWPKGMMI
ncbi:MAG: terminase family protein [Verrucomicrobiota bacterium]